MYGHLLLDACTEYDLSSFKGQALDQNMCI